MPENLKALRRRIRSIKNTRQITKAMEMVSASKLKRTETALQAARPFGERLVAMLRRLVAAGATPADALFTPRDEVKTRLLVLFGADRGLCGGYNAYIFKQFNAAVADCEASGIAIRVFPVGKRAVEFIRKYYPEVPQAEAISSHGGKLSVEDAEKLAKVSIEEYKSEAVDDVVFVYNQFITTSKYEPTREKFLPFDLEALLGNEEEAEDQSDETAAREYIYEPGAEAVFEALLPRFIQSRVFVALASAITAEHAARMLAMNAATKNCGELIDKLTLRLNKARQAQITTEIIEIVSGAEAINA